MNVKNLTMRSFYYVVDYNLHSIFKRQYFGTPSYNPHLYDFAFFTEEEAKIHLADFEQWQKEVSNVSQA